jgi:hypothetical protein
MSAGPSNEDLPKRDADPVILFAIREGIGQWPASTGQVVENVLIMRRAERRRQCCGRDLTLVAEVTRGSMTWGLWRCTGCESEYSIGPALSPGWVNTLARLCIDLYSDLQTAIAEAYGRQDG